MERSTFLLGIHVLTSRSAKHVPLESPCMLAVARSTCLLKSAKHFPLELPAFLAEGCSEGGPPVYMALAPLSRGLWHLVVLDRRILVLFLSFLFLSKIVSYRVRSLGVFKKPYSTSTLGAS